MATLDIVRPTQKSAPPKPKVSAASKIEGMAYAASGIAMSCSYVMLIQMLTNASVSYGGQFITYLWPAALLSGSFCMARMWGHFYQRSMPKGMAVMGAGFCFLEGVSIMTSYYSAMLSASGGAVMGTKQQLWCLLVALTLSVIALVPAIGIEMMKGRESSGKKPEAAALRVVK